MHAGAQIRLHIVSRYPVYREGLAGGLTRDQGIMVTGSSASPDDIEPAIDFDVLLTDLSSSMNKEQRLIGACASKGKRVVILGTPEQAKDMYDAMIAGASAFISKALSVEEIISSIMDVCAGIQPAAYRQLDDQVWAYGDAARDPQTGIDPVFKKLTTSESDILMMICEGSTNKEIADRLRVSERTIRRHLTSIFNKIGVRNRTAAIARAIKGKKTGSSID